MEVKPLIQVIASESLPELDKRYSKWCENIQIPALLRNPNLLCVSRYRIIVGISDPSHPGLAEPKEGYAKYLTIFEFENEEAFKTFDRSPEMEEALANEIQTWESGEIVVKFRAQYRLRYTWEGKVKAKVGIIHTSGVNIPPEADETFNRYYFEKAIPTITGNPYLMGVDSYELVKGLARSDYPFTIEPKGGYPKYYNIYKLESVEAFRAYEYSHEMTTNSRNFTNFAESWPPGTFKVAIRAQYIPIGSWAR